MQLPEDKEFAWDGWAEWAVGEKLAGRKVQPRVMVELGVPLIGSGSCVSLPGKDYPPYHPEMTESRSLKSIILSAICDAAMRDQARALDLLALLLGQGCAPEFLVRTWFTLAGIGLPWVYWVPKIRSTIGKPIPEAREYLLTWLRTEKPGGIPARGKEATEQRIQKTLELLLNFHAPSRSSAI
jgi:hypothetical protein